MKTCINIIIISLLFFLVSCDSWLDLKPETQVTEDELFNSGDGYRASLNGLYKTMGTASLYGRELSFGMVDCISQQYQMDLGTTITYDQKYVDTVEIGHGTIWGARFEHGGKNYYAIPFMQDGKVSYWDEQGQSLRKNLLKAPLKYSRISSRFSASRLHPILRIRRPHYGVDYAAPSGTPVVAVGDGVVIAKGYGGGGGNTLKIKHNSGQLVSGYLHLKGYAKGINKGTRVRQGQLIGYVGATGLATGPHLDFRLWRNGTPIDPLKVPTEPAEPVRAANKQAFDGVRDRIMAELNGTLADSLKVTSFAPAADTSRAANPDSVKQTPAR